MSLSTNSAVCAMRVRFADRACVIFLTSRDDKAEWTRNNCIHHQEELTLYPFYFLTFFLNRSSEDLCNWFSDSDREVEEIEAATKMTNPNFRIDWIPTEKIQWLSNADNLLTQLHSTNAALCSDDASLAASQKFGNFCLESVEAFEKERELQGYPRVQRFVRDGYSENIKYYLNRFQSLEGKMNDTRGRLQGQINVVSLSLWMRAGVPGN
jgi:hypothetical protein